MINVENTNFFIGSYSDYQGIANQQDWAFVHATKTYHYKSLGWEFKLSKQYRSHPNYICYEKDNHFSLNWVDGAAYLYDWTDPETFIKVLDFIDKWIQNRKVLVHCDQGMSRAPTLGLLYCAKRLKIISNDSFDIAKQEFLNIGSNYNPGGIGEYVKQKWDDIK